MSPERRMAIIVAVVRYLVGFAGLAAIVVGVWGKFGWEVGVIAAGLPFAGFFLWGEAMAVVRHVTRGPV